MSTCASKTVNGVVHNYTVSGSLILTEEWGTNLVVYLYDANGEPIGMRYRTSSMAEGVFYTFWFEKMHRAMWWLFTTKLARKS